MLYICAKFREIISNDNKVIERTRFYRGIIPQKNVGGVTVVNLFTSSGHAFYYPLAQQSCGGDIGSVPYVCM